MFIPEAEKAQYKRALFTYAYEDVTLVGCPEDGIDKVRKYIGETAQSIGCEKFIMMDDDLAQFAIRIKPESVGLKKADLKDVELMLDTVVQYLDWYAHVSISARFHNEMYNGEFPIVVENKRAVRFLAYRTKEFLECEHGRVPIMEDFDITLQLLDRGFKNAVLYYWCQDQTQTQMAGGCSTYRTHELHESGVLKLAELWPNVVKTRIKQNKGGGDFGTRLEATIQWEQAYKEVSA